MNAKFQDDERASFSDRLKGALRAAGYELSPTKVVSEFNLRADGLVVTVHGARKWLIGDAIPTQARIKVLADWLGVSAAWLRFGDADNSEQHTLEPSAFTLDSAELVFVHDMRLLSDGGRALLRDVLDSILRSENAHYAQRNKLRSKRDA